jgi:hypothetical protein
LIDDDDCRRSDRAEVAEEFLEALAKRMTALLDASPDPDALMASIREKAGQAGIMPPGMKIRSLPYAAFVRDLLLDNPRAIDWAYRSRFDMASANVSDETELLGLIALRGRA